MAANGGAKEAAAPAAEPVAPHLRLLFDPQELWDFTLLTSDGVEVKVHKAILAQSSRFFASLFTDMRDSASLAVPESLRQLLPLLRIAYISPPRAQVQPDSCGGAAREADTANGTATSSAADPASASTPSGGSSAPLSCPACGLQFGAEVPGADAPMCLCNWVKPVAVFSLRDNLEAARKFDCPALTGTCDLGMTGQDFTLEVMLYTQHGAQDGTPCPWGAAAAAELSAFDCLALAHAYHLPLAKQHWQQQILGHAADVTASWQQPGSAGRSAAVRHLADQPELAAELAADALAQAGSMEAEMKQLRHQVALGERQRRKVQAFRAALDQHVRDFRGAKEVRGAVKAKVHATQ